MPWNVRILTEIEVSITWEVLAVIIYFKPKIRMCSLEYTHTHTVFL